MAITSGCQVAKKLVVRQVIRSFFTYGSSSMRKFVDENFRRFAKLNSLCISLGGAALCIASPVLADDQTSSSSAATSSSSAATSSSSAATSSSSQSPSNSSPSPARLSRPPADHSLQGRVEQRDGVNKLSRPLEGHVGLNQSVKILSGIDSLNAQVDAMSNVQEAKSEEDVLNSTLDSRNFNLSTYQKMTPLSQTASAANINQWSPLSTTTGRLRKKRQFIDGKFKLVWHPYPPGFGDGPAGWWERIYIPGSEIDKDSWELQTNTVSSSLGVPQMPAGAMLPFPNNSDFNLSTPSIPSIPPIAPYQRTAPSWILPAVKPLPPVPQAYKDTNIGWDGWYKTVSNALYSNWSKLNSLPGEAKLHITVKNDRTISAQILTTNNFQPAFKDSLNKAVASLNGNTVLVFPNSTRRRVVAFDSVFTSGTHTLAGAFSERTNDVERVRSRR